MERIEHEATRMGRLVEDLLLLARLDQGRPLEREPVDVVTVALDAVAAAGAVEPDRPITVDIGEGPAEVRGDQFRLRQVVDNLLANVRDHTPPGTRASVRVSATDGDVTLVVADEGPGMSTEDVSHAFDRFWQAGGRRLGRRARRRPGPVDRGRDRRRPRRADRLRRRPGPRVDVHHHPPSLTGDAEPAPTCLPAGASTLSA